MGSPLTSWLANESPDSWNPASLQPELPTSDRFRFRLRHPERGGWRLAEDDGRRDFGRLGIPERAHLRHVEPEFLDLGRHAVAADQHGREPVGDVRQRANSHDVGYAADELGRELARVAVEETPHGAVDPVPPVPVRA